LKYGRDYIGVKNNMKYLGTIPNERRNWEKGTAESTGRQDRV
jgi:hypothetical protein